MGRVGAEGHSCTAGGRPRVRGRDRRSRIECQRLCPRRHRERRGPRRMRKMPKLHGRPPAFVCRHQGVGVNRPGAFAEFVALPMTNIWKHDPSVPREIAAIFDPFGNAVHTALQFPVLGEDVLITGAGPIGIMAAAVVRHAGARYVVITDVNPYRLELARKMGVTVAIDVRKCPSPIRKAAGHARRLRCGTRNGGKSVRVFGDAGQHESRCKDCRAGIPPRRWLSTGTGSFSICSQSRASMAARCMRPGTR